MVYRTRGRLDRALAEELWAAEAPVAADMVVQLVHGDFWDNNVKFAGDEVIAILDFDFMEARPRIDDLALTLYYAYPSLLADRGDEAAREALATLVRSYVSAAQVPLGRSEVSGLPYAIARTALHFTRHLALRANEREQREVVDAAAPDLHWALTMVRDADAWREAFQI